MGKRKFAIFESSEGEEYDGPYEYVMQASDMLAPVTVASGETVTIADEEQLLVKRRIKIKGILKIEDTGILGVV